MKVTVEVSFIDDSPGNHAPFGAIAKYFEEDLIRAMRAYKNRWGTDCAWCGMDISAVADEVSAKKKGADD